MKSRNTAARCPDGLTPRPLMMMVERKTKKMTKFFKCDNKTAYRMIKATEVVGLWDATKAAPLDIAVEKAVIFDTHSEQYGDSLVVRILSGGRIYQARNRAAEECDVIFAFAGAEPITIRFARKIGKTGREYLDVDIADETPAGGQPF